MIFGSVTSALGHPRARNPGEEERQGRFAHPLEKYIVQALVEVKVRAVARHRRVRIEVTGIRFISPMVAEKEGYLIVQRFVGANDLLGLFAVLMVVEL